MVRIHTFLLLAFLLVSSQSLHGADSGNLIIRADSPQSYTVVEGDTLWDIAGVFLQEPWLWPEIWQVNPQIENPDLIYPGDTISLYYQDGVPRLTLQREGEPAAAPDDLPLVRLSPQIRREALPGPVAAVDFSALSNYLTRNRILGIDELDDAPVLLQSRSGRQFSSRGDMVYAFGDWPQGQNNFDIVRPAQELRDPQSGRAIAMETLLIGQASMRSREGQQAMLEIERSTQEVRQGDYFVARLDSQLPQEAFPSAPASEIDAEVLSIEFGLSAGGINSNIIINAGAAEALQPGHLLILQKPEQRVENTTLSSNPLRPGPRGNRMLSFSGEVYGRVLIYKVFENHSFGLVLSSSEPVRLGDRLVSP